MGKIKIYVGCALMDAPQSFKNQIQELKIELKKNPDIEILEFLGQGSGTPADIYHHDIHDCVKKADIVLGIATYPSTGLGYELSVAVEASVTTLVIICTEKNKKISNLIRGVSAFPQNQPRVTFYEYDKIFDIIPVVEQVIEKHINYTLMKVN